MNDAAKPNTNIFSRRKAYQRDGSVNRRDIKFRTKQAGTPIDFINQRLDTSKKIWAMNKQADIEKME